MASHSPYVPVLKMSQRAGNVGRPGFAQSSTHLMLKSVPGFFPPRLSGKTVRPWAA